MYNLEFYEFTDYKKTYKSSCLSLQGPADVTVVIEDVTASTASELRVTKGQQVEVVDAAPGHSEVCLIRTVPSDGSEPQQGLVPMSALKPIPILRVPGSRNSIELDGRN